MESFSLIAWRKSDGALIVVALALALVLGVVTATLYVVFTVIRVDGDSMRPVLEDEDRLLLTRDYETPRAGDIVAFDIVDETGHTVRLVKRVVAIPGDTVEIIGDTAFVNGEASLIAPTAAVGTSSDHLAPMVVPSGTVYVLGDNRPVALDSRFLGPIPLTSIAGKATAIIYPPLRIGAID